MDVFDEQMIEFLHGGCGLLVGSVDSDGRPHAARGWGLSMVDGHPARVRLLVDAADETTLANLHPGASVAITTASVRTLHSVQMKGRVVGTEPATAADERKRQQYTDDFIHDIHDTDGDPIEMLEMWSVRHVAACVVDIDVSFDQTPGPSAGSPMGAP